MHLAVAFTLALILTVILQQHAVESVVHKHKRVILRVRSTPFPKDVKLMKINANGKMFYAIEEVHKRAVQENSGVVDVVEADVQESAWLLDKEIGDNLEGSAIRLGKEEFANLREERERVPQKPLLCVSFVRASLDPSIVIQSNMLQTSKLCDWAVVFYDGFPTFQKGLCSNAEVTSVVNIVYCKVFNYTHTSQCASNLTSSMSNLGKLKNIPKSVLYFDLLPYLKYYSQVLIMDEDISLMSFNITHALALWRCGFAYPPLIAQPTIYEDKIFYPFLDKSSWEGKNYVISATGIVEQQVPMFDSMFLEWFISRVLDHTAPCAEMLGVDWGLDQIWCPAAKAYGRQVLGWSNYSNPCAIIIGAHSVHHLDTRSIRTKRLNPSQFRNNGKIIVDIYREYFPLWMSQGSNRNNPLDPAVGSFYAKITKERMKCNITA